MIGGLCQRLTPDEARDLIAQLPSRLQPELQRYPAGELADGLAQLPNELRALLPEPPLRKAG